MKLREDFYAVLPGEIYPQTIPAGTECPPELIDAARDAGVLGDDHPLAAVKAAAAVEPTQDETASPRRVAKGPGGRWFVWLGDERVSRGFATEEEANAAAPIAGEA